MDKEQVIELLKKYKKEISENFGVTKIGIFGSVARGTSDGDSDIDVVVVLKKQNLLNTIGLRNDLEEYFETPVDVVNYRDSLSPLLKRRIDKDVIYV